MQKINVLGTEYTVEETTEKEYCGLRDRSGCCDRSSKAIKLMKDWDEKAYYAYDNIDYAKKQTLRHEIVHAFLFESGNTDMSHSEATVEWIAVMFPKMLETFKQINAL